MPLLVPNIRTQAKPKLLVRVSFIGANCRLQWEMSIFRVQKSRVSNTGTEERYSLLHQQIFSKRILLTWLLSFSTSKLYEHTKHRGVITHQRTTCVEFTWVRTVRWFASILRLTRAPFSMSQACPFNSCRSEFHKKWPCESTSVSATEFWTTGRDIGCTCRTHILLKLIALGRSGSLLALHRKRALPSFV
jgi:hypothetical protein